MQKIYLKLKNTIIEDIIITNDAIDTTNLTEIAKLPDAVLADFEPNKYKFENGKIIARRDNRGSYWEDDGTEHVIADFDRIPDTSWVTDYTKTERYDFEQKQFENTQEWERNDSLYTQWQKAEKLGWTQESLRLKKEFHAHTVKVTLAWRSLQKLKNLSI